MRPYMTLSESEAARGRLFDRQIVVQNTGRTAQYFMQTKEWFPERFQAVVSALKNDFQFIQVGSPRDPKLEGAHDLRGRTTIRENGGFCCTVPLYFWDWSVS